MRNFYDDWLSLWEKGVEERRSAKKVIYPEELQWVRTRQDYYAALLVAPETGFRTLGGVTMLAEIPPGWKTGKHLHGEEAIYILKGKGFSVIDYQRFDWEEGACIRIPFGAPHQHFNEGETPVQYYAALAPQLEQFCSVAKFEQLEDCSEIRSRPSYSCWGSDHEQLGRRVVLHRWDAATAHHGEHAGKPRDSYGESLPHQMHKVQHGKIIKLMGGYEDFRGDEVEITDIFIDRPKSLSEKHAHMEAILYILQGEGYSIVNGEKFPWRPGTSLHIQGPQTFHQHFITSDIESHQLRTHFGIRKYIQPIAKDAFPYVFLEEGRQL